MKIEMKASTLGAWTAYVDGVKFPIKGIWLSADDLLIEVLRSVGTTVSYTRD